MAMTERTARVAAPAALALFALLGVLMTPRPAGVALAAWAVVLVTGVALAWRRTTGWPLAVAFLGPVAATVVLGAAQSSNLAWMGLCVVAAWVALTSSAAVVVAAGVVLELTVAAQWLPQTEEAGWAAWVVGTGFSLVACVFARRLRQTVEDLGRAQVQLAERSRAEERTRIAAEVHDVIGHALTVSLLHISSARLALDEEPEEARRSLEEAERLARDSLEEVRATVGLVRADATVRTAPLPGAEQVAELVGSFRRAGARVELTVTGDLSVLGPTRGLVVYRVLQEALTNATRHAPGEPVHVQVTVEERGATVTVHNSGPGDAAALPGSGLTGMRERVEGVGGRLRAGTQPDVGRSGWLVEAVLPT
jgi:signal transduction histidine kinase